MHRTVSLDYGVVLEGEVELVLDSGETRLMKRGDVSVQRGTNHAWRNMGCGGVVGLCSVAPNSSVGSYSQFSSLSAYHNAILGYQ